jgi:hypothetical protein
VSEYERLCKPARAQDRSCARAGGRLMRPISDWGGSGLPRPRFSFFRAPHRAESFRRGLALSWTHRVPKAQIRSERSLEMRPDAEVSRDSFRAPYSDQLLFRAAAPPTRCGPSELRHGALFRLPTTGLRSAPRFRNSSAKGKLQPVSSTSRNTSFGSAP